jgi:glucose/arabinose dehydrogenase
MNRFATTAFQCTTVFALAAAPLPAQDSECRPVESRPPNGTTQQPAFKGQTRICAVTTPTRYAVTVLAKDLANPWSVEPLPDGDFLVTEKPGRMRIVSANGTVGDPIEGVPAVEARGQGGLLDAALSPGFATDRTVFWSFSEKREGGNATSVARGTLSADRKRLTDVKVIFRAQPAYDGGAHFGSRLAFGPDGMLYISLGERSDNPIRPQAQQLDSHMGKIIRIAPDGSVPRDNPFVGTAGALPETWDLGHRNVEALAFDGSGQLWEVEHGTRGGDELNRVEKGKNYGWPIQAYGIEYSGSPIVSALGPAATARDGTEQPVYYWDPVIAPSGAQFYSGDAFPAWQGSLFIGSLGQLRLVRLTIADGVVTGEEQLLADRNSRIRDVRQGPDGFLYVVTDASKGELWRIAPAK